MMTKMVAFVRPLLNRAAKTLCALFTGSFLAYGTNALAITNVGCPNGFKQTEEVHLNFKVLQSVGGCPLIETKAYLRQVERFVPVTKFAYPTIPGTCLSGVLAEGENNYIKLRGGEILAINRGSSESAQRLFWEAENLDPTNGGLFINSFLLDGNLIFSGAAVTRVEVGWGDTMNAAQRLVLILSDRFTFDALGRDFEEFRVEGSSGAFKAEGMLTGTGQILSPPGSPLVLNLLISGTLCLR